MANDSARCAEADTRSTAACRPAACAMRRARATWRDSRPLALYTVPDGHSRVGSRAWGRMRKKTVYLIDLGTGADTNLLPLSIGMVGSYSMSIPEISEAYNFEFRFLRDDFKKIVDGLESPAVVGFACYVWNVQASLALARAIKQSFPNALLVAGGYSVPKEPHRIAGYFAKNPWMDVLVHGEGELTFANLLCQLLLDGDLSKVAGLTFRTDDHAAGFLTTARPARVEDLDTLPSPFLNGTFDKLMRQYGHAVTGTVWETNRGCPFSCTFCDWGNADVNKVKRFTLDRLREEMRWISRNEISYIFCADANFGIFYERDLEIAGLISEISKSSGHPRHFTVNWTKNSHEYIGNIADVLAKGGVISDITVSVQSLNPSTLHAIKRRNLEESQIAQLKKKFHDLNLPTYTEFILGLPEETYESFVGGLEEVMGPCLLDHFIIYVCSLLENTEISAEDYRKKYKIESRHCKYSLSRRSPIDASNMETEELVVGTASMPGSSWEQTYVFAYTTTVLFNHRLAVFIMNFLRQQFGTKYTDFVHFVLDEVSKCPGEYPCLEKGLTHIHRQKQMIMDGVCSMSAPKGLDDLVLTVHEGALALLLQDLDGFYENLHKITRAYCMARGLDLSEDILREILRYQKARMPRWPTIDQRYYEFETNVPEYFSLMTQGHEPPPIEYSPTSVVVKIPGNTVESYSQFLRHLVRGGRRVDVYEVEFEKRRPLLITAA